MPVFDSIRDVPPTEFKLSGFLRQIKSSLEVLISLFNGHSDTSWHDINTWANSWKNYEDIYETAAYCKDGHGFVHLRGLIKLGTVNLPAFVLPPGYRPRKTILLLVLAKSVGDYIGRLQITPDGVVTPLDPAGSTYLSLDGVSFYAG